MAIIGAILGDIAGSQYEYNRPQNLDYRKCDLFTDDCSITDDTVTSIAIKYAVDSNVPYQDALREIGVKHPSCGYGPKYFEWLFCENPKPYNSFGNGSAMRVSYIGEYYEILDDAKREAEKSAMVSHNHPEGIKGAVVTAVCVWMAKHGCDKDDIYKYVLSEYPIEKYKFPISKSLSQLQDEYSWDVTCMTSVPVAMRCFFESDSYEGFLRNVFSLECDMDTLCAIGGGVAEEYYHGTGLYDYRLLKRYLTRDLLEIIGIRA